MAAVKAHNREGPLADATNEPMEPLHLSSKHLQRTDSFRLLYRHMDSSESIPSFHESIWDADLPSSNECKTKDDKSLPEIPAATATQPPLDLSLVLPVERVDGLFHTATPNDQAAQEPVLPAPTKLPGDHHPTQLEPISEQRSIASQCASSSKGRLGHSPVRNVTVVRKQQSYHSIHPSQRSKRAIPTSRSERGTDPRRRAFSFDDLDCFVLPSFHCIIKKTRSSISSSSDPRAQAAMVRGSCVPAEPRRPPHTPPARSPTPPGVPSFGSPEAVSYFSRPRARSSSWWRPGRLPQREPNPPHPTAAAAALTSNLAPPAVPSCQSKRLSRHVNIFGNESSRVITSAPRTASMPAVAFRAEDGTVVRGRFGGRMSGHGISSRGIDGHPIQRAAAASRERKENDVNCSWAIPRQRGRVSGNGGQLGMMSTVNDLARVERRDGGLPSRVASWLGGSQQSSHRQENREMEERSRGHIDLAADREHMFGRNADQSHGRNGPRRNPNDVNNVPTSNVGSSNNHNNNNGTSDQKCNYPSLWHCLRTLCICCCNFSDLGLTGGGTARPDRPCLSDGEERVRDMRHTPWDHFTPWKRLAMAHTGIAPAPAPGPGHDPISRSRHTSGRGVHGGMTFRPGGSQGY